MQKKSFMSPLWDREGAAEADHRSLSSNFGQKKPMEMNLRSHVHDNRQAWFDIRDNKPAESKRIENKSSDDINECAEAFVKRFKQQLLIQRLESIENYEKMLARGL